MVRELMSQAARSAWVNVLRLTSNEWRASRDGMNIVVYASPSQHWVTHRDPRSLRSLARVKPLQSWSGRSQYVGYAIFAAARCLKRVSQPIPAKKGDKICQPGSGAECSEEARSVSVCATISATSSRTVSFIHSRYAETSLVILSPCSVGRWAEQNVPCFSRYASHWRLSDKPALPWRSAYGLGISERSSCRRIELLGIGISDLASILE
jgi:hypothetical protein